MRRMRRSRRGKKRCRRAAVAIARMNLLLGENFPELYCIYEPSPLACNLY